MDAKRKNVRKKDRRNMMTERWKGYNEKKDRNEITEEKLKKERKERK